ncbi:glycosyl hydrolase family 28-related protein [Flavobacterium sp. 2]|uniref:glycosyl hydrolase family 28-related protein n=1 Tax=Flavobacterium sp. 2 TaxID=308053 RepID=UPI003CF167C9
MTEKRFLKKSSIILLFLLCCNIGIYAKGKDYLVTAFGAVADGKTLNTTAIQKAIDAAYKNKGGRVIVSKGKFLSGSIVLKDNVELFFEDGAILLGSINPNDYPKYEGIRALVLAYNSKNIAIYRKRNY